MNLPMDETVGLVGLHWGDNFYEFVPQNGKVKWQVKPWGSWKVQIFLPFKKRLDKAISP